MSKKNASRNNANKGNRIEPPNSTANTNTPIETKDEKDSCKANAEQAQKQQYCPHQIVIGSSPKKEKPFWKKISFWALILNFVYVGATVLIYNEAHKSSLEVKNEFAIGNEPYLQITNPFIPKFEIGDTLQINFSIENLGKYPVKVDTFRFYFDVSPNPFSFRSIDTTVHFYKSIANTYLAFGKSDNYKIPMANIVDSNSRKLIKMGDWKFYFIGYIKYTNEITKDLKEYKFEFELNPFDKLDKRTIVNTNDTILVHKY